MGVLSTGLFSCRHPWQRGRRPKQWKAKVSLRLTVYPHHRYNLAAKISGGLQMINFLNVSLILTSIALVASIILQSKGAGLGGLTGSDAGGVFTARRGVEKTLFVVTIVFSVLFFALAITLVILSAQ
jgi:preprotein translocase subunit SecG